MSCSFALLQRDAWGNFLTASSSSVIWTQAGPPAGNGRDLLQITRIPHRLRFRLGQLFALKTKPRSSPTAMQPESQPLPARHYHQDVKAAFPGRNVRLALSFRSSRVIDLITATSLHIPNWAIDRVDARPARAWLWLQFPYANGNDFYGTVPTYLQSPFSGP